MSKNLKIFFFSLAILISNSICSFAQSETWQRVFGLDSNVVGIHGIQTSDGGYLILAQWDPESIHPDRTRAIKLDNFGNLIWTRNYEVKTFNSVIEDGDSNYLLIGAGGAGAGAALLKINYLGDSIIYRLYGDASISRFNFIKKYFDGGYILSGDGSNGLNNFAYIARVDINLDIIWENSYYDSTYTGIRTSDFVLDPNNNIAITVTGNHVQKGLLDGGIFKINSNGNLYLKQFYSNYPIKVGFGNILITKDNKYSISGGADSFFSDSISSVYCVLDTNGNLLYRKYYYDFHSFYGRLAFAGGNNFALGGHNIDNNRVEIKMGIRKIDFMGNIIWTRIIKNALNISAPSSMSSTKDGGFLLTGNYENVPINRYSIYIIKTDSNAYANPLGISNLTAQIPYEFILYHAYPNPFNNSAKIKYEIKQSGYYKMEIFDINGKLISLIFNERLIPGFYEENLYGYFNLLPSSVYFIRLSDFMNFKTQRVLFIK